MPRPLKVFLCHAHSDKDAVKSLYSRLKRESVDAWLDKEKLLPGADWEYEIRRAVRASDVVIVCLSKQFNQAGFRQKEVRIALEEADKKPEGEIFIIPARLEECDNLESLSRWHWVDLFESDGFQRLILALRIRADKIGATLRQRGVTPSQSKIKSEQQYAENERTGQIRRDAEGQERQGPVREPAEREPTEITAWEAPEKEEHVHPPHEVDEKAERERLNREAAEKAERERLAREENEKDESERLAQEAAQKAEPERLLRETKEIKELKKGAQLSVANLDVEKNRESAPKLYLRSLGIAGFAVVFMLLVVLGGNYLYKNVNPTQTENSSRPTFTPIPQLGVGSTLTSEKDGMVLVYVLAGEFTMGNGGDEHQVYLDAFWFDQTEVTNAMYSKCVSDGGCSVPSSVESNTRNSYYVNPLYSDFPVIYVNWQQANDYCVWAGRKLPSEAQWEKTARGPIGNVYPWGNDYPEADFLNYNQEIDDTTQVGLYPKGESVYGALDMAGNVREWVSSLYDPYPYNPNDGRENPYSTRERVLRGGSWNDFFSGVYSAVRYGYIPTNSYNNVGFRCALVTK